MSKTFKDLPERVKARLADKGTGNLIKEAEVEDRSFALSSNFIFLSTDVDRLEAFKKWLESREATYRQTEFYGYLIQEDSQKNRELLEDPAFPLLSELAELTPFPYLQEGHEEKREAQERFNEMQDEYFKSSRRILGPELYTSISVKLEVEDRTYLESLEADESYSLPVFKKDLEGDLPVKESSAERRAVRVALQEEVKEVNSQLIEA